MEDWAWIGTQLIAKQAFFQVLLTLFLSATSLPEAVQE